MEAARRQRLGRRALYALGVLGLPLVFFLISLHNVYVYDYGETSDEAYDQAIGRLYYEDYPKTGFADLDVRLDKLQRNYGAFWAIVDAWSGDILINRTGCSRRGSCTSRRRGGIFSSSSPANVP